MQTTQISSKTNTLESFDTLNFTRNIFQILMLEAPLKLYFFLNRLFQVFLHGSNPDDNVLFHFPQVRISSWPKEVPGSWFSEFKRGKIVSFSFFNFFFHQPFLIRIASRPLSVFTLNVFHAFFCVAGRRLSSYNQTAASATVL